MNSANRVIPGNSLFTIVEGSTWKAVETNLSLHINNLEYFLYNTVTHETITLCDYDDSECIRALQGQGFYMLDPKTYGEDRYAYPAIYKSPGIVWDQSEERTTNGDWTMMSKEMDDDDGSDIAVTPENPVYVIYNDGRRNNTGMGLYYLGNSHQYALAEYGLKGRETPFKYIPLWMSDGMDLYKDQPSFPRPGGAREGLTTGILEHKGKYHVIFQDETNQFKRISFKLKNGNGFAVGGEKRLKTKLIHKLETKKSVDLNGDGIFGAPPDQTDGLSGGEYNNAAFSNKIGDRKLLRKLQSGGLVIYLSHPTTNIDYADQADPYMFLDDCSTQRNLNTQGKAEAEAIGAGFVANDILIGEVIVSEYCRTKDTAIIAYGGYDVVDSNLNLLPFENYTKEQLDAYHDKISPILSQGVERGNKVIVGHDDPFEGATNIRPNPPGTAYVLKPNNGDSFEIIARLEPNDWAFGADI